MTEYAIWTPEYTGHTPPSWREGMEWGEVIGEQDFGRSGTPAWIRGWLYKVPAEALNSPNDDASGDVDTWKLDDALKEVASLREKDVFALAGAVKFLSRFSADELARLGVTISPPKDWATHLFADLLEAWDMPEAARRVRTGNASDDDGAAIELLHARVEQMMAELKEYVVAFGAPWAVQYSRDFGLPEGHLHPRHYDILERCGARLDDFVLAKLEASWFVGTDYIIPVEALSSPNDDAEDRMRDYAIKTLLQEGEDALNGLVRELRQYPAEELAKHGITLAPERDWATELWADVLEAWDMHETAELVRRGAHGAAFIGPINLLRTRFEQMKAERSKRDD